MSNISCTKVSKLGHTSRTQPSTNLSCSYFMIALPSPWKTMLKGGAAQLPARSQSKREFLQGLPERAARLGCAPTAALDQVHNTQSYSGVRAMGELQAQVRAAVGEVRQQEGKCSNEAAKPSFPAYAQPQPSPRQHLSPKRYCS